MGIERITLPEANTSYVFERMRAERSQFAERYLAEGRQQADAIRAKTNADKTVILAEAQKQAEIKRGQGEAEAAHIYSKAHSQNPELYLFLRELETLEKDHQPEYNPGSGRQPAAFRFAKERNQPTLNSAR